MANDATLKIEIPNADTKKDEFYALFVKEWSLRLIECTTDKKGITTDAEICQFTIDLNNILYGAIECGPNKTNEIIGIGYITWDACIIIDVNRIDNYLLNDNDIDYHNIITIKIDQLKNIPSEWINKITDNNNNSNDEQTTDNKKSKNKKDKKPVTSQSSSYLTNYLFNI